MKITVDIEEKWLDDESLEEGLKSSIKYDVISQIKTSIEEKVRTEITNQIKEQIQKTMAAKIKRYVTKVLKSEKIETHYDGVHKIEDYIRMRFKQGGGDTSPKEIIDKMAQKFSKELKQRYDLLFASQIVNKMSEHNLVRKDVAELLLEDNNKS